MATALYYECFAGISGDMHLGALVDVGVPAQYLKSELGKLELADEFELQLETGAKMGIAGTCATVRLAEGIDRPRPSSQRHQEHYRPRRLRA